jgi:hypothetical protein
MGAIECSVLALEEKCDDLVGTNLVEDDALNVMEAS